ncbi:MAG: hypothetical protein ACM33T_16450 [Solirubrobacterales bacterium]
MTQQGTSKTGVPVDVVLLDAGSVFSVEVFKTIRPSIPRERWPGAPVRGSFKPHASGRFLEATFEDLPASYSELAARLVAAKGVELMAVSPVAYRAAMVVRAKRWRDAFLFAAVPLLFAIPLMAALSATAMKISGLLFAVDMAALVLAHMAVINRRAILISGRFIASIPVPGMRLAGKPAQKG